MVEVLLGHERFLVTYWNVFLIIYVQCLAVFYHRKQSSF